MRPLTLERPKPLIEVAGRPLIEHILEALPAIIDEVIVIIGYKGEMLRERLGERVGARRISYVRQERPEGTAAALALARAQLSGRFLLLCGDDIQGARALAEACQHPLAVLAARHAEPSRFGVIETDARGMVTGIEEKPLFPRSNLVSTGALVLDERIFAYEAPRNANGESYVTDQLAALAGDAPVRVVEQERWIPLGYPEDVERAERALAGG